MNESPQSRWLLFEFDQVPMSAKTVFISYRRDSGKHFARSLKTALGHREYDVFFDVDSINAGDWEKRILTEIPKRAHFLFLLTPGALDRCADAGDMVRREFELAWNHGRNIVPVCEESVDLAAMMTSAPECMRPLFKMQIATIRQNSFESDIMALTQRYIAEHMAPAVAQPVAPPSFRCEISRIDKYVPDELIGREAEMKILNDAWTQTVAGEKARPHILTFVAHGGEGKTSLVAKWTAELAHQDWPGCEAAFAWSFYREGSSAQTAVSSDLFLKEALVFFGDSDMASSAQGSFEKGRRLAQLVGQQRTLLILDGLEPLQYAPGPPLDGKLKDDGVASLLKGLAANSRGLCVVTTRYSVPDLRAYRQTTAPEWKLPRLSRQAGVHLLQSLGVRGSQLRNILLHGGVELVNEFEALIEDVKGHALTLNLIGTYLRDAHGGDIRQRDRVKLEEADAEEQGGHAFRVMDAYVESFISEGKKGKQALALLGLLGLFDRPAIAECLAALLKRPGIPGLTEPLVAMSETQRNIALTRLESAKLLTVNRDAAGALLSLDAHPLLREYFAKRVREPQPKAWRAAHRRLYEHLCATTIDKPQPTLEELQPLYQAISHGCHAGMQQEVSRTVYSIRIMQGENGYSIRKLGAIGSTLTAVTCFFETPWNKVSPLLEKTDQAAMANMAAYCLHALGRLSEALVPMQFALENVVTLQALDSAAKVACNLVDLKLTLGNLVGAIEDAELSVTYADRSHDAFLRMMSRATHAYVLHQANLQIKAEARFREAEEVQIRRQDDYPLLYSLTGFKYCDLLLAASERAAWRYTANIRPTGPSDLSREDGDQPSQDATTGKEKLLESCRTVSQRATRTLDWSINPFKNLSLADIALDHLTLGRAALYVAILENTEFRELDPSSTVAGKSDIDQAAAGLRRAGTQHIIPDGLLTRAWLRYLTDARTGSDSAQADLDEAWDIAERGPMRLFMADIHLYRARLFGRKSELALQPYPWGSPEHDLAEARRLIFECGYLRREEELKDAEMAIRGELGTTEK